MSLDSNTISLATLPYDSKSTPFFYYSAYMDYYEHHWKNKLLQGNIFEKIETFPKNFFWSSIFSPPYWKVRDYGTIPQLFGGNPTCDHVWYDYTKKGISGGLSCKTLYKRKGVLNFQIVKDSKQAICIKCGCEKLEFGQEPFMLDHSIEFEEGHPVLVKGYMTHLCELCDHILQKTRQDGAMFINLGDVYATQGGQNIKNDDDNEYTDYASINLNHKMIGKQLLKSDEFPSLSLTLLPNRFAIRMLDDYGYIVRNELIWKKNNPFPQSQWNKFTINFEKWWFIVKNNTPLYWVNQKTLEMVTKQPKGTRGEEDYDWKYDICDNCLKEIESEPDLLDKYLEPQREKFWFIKDIATLFTTMSNLSEESIKDLHLKSVCDRQNCEDGKWKRTLWRPYNYYFEQQLEPLKQDFPKITKNARNKNEGYTNKTYSGFVYNSQDHLHGKNRRTIWEINTKGEKNKHFAAYNTDVLEFPIDASVPKYFCKKCGLPRIKVYGFRKVDPIEIYSGHAKKDYETAMAQNPSDTKRRILESMRKIRFLVGYSHCICAKPDYAIGFGFDPFNGSGTTSKALLDHNNHFIGYEIKAEYNQMAKEKVIDQLRNVRLDQMVKGVIK